MAFRPLKTAPPFFKALAPDEPSAKGGPVPHPSRSSTHFQHQDWLGTERLRTTYNGAVEGSFTSLPFGDAYAASGSDADPYHYAQLDYDSETNTDHAQFRQYNSTQGRWMRPDPYYGSYDFSNPQSFNRYAYALNNPLSATDRLGLVLCYYGGDTDPDELDDPTNWGDEGSDSDCQADGGVPWQDGTSITVNGDGSDGQCSGDCAPSLDIIQAMCSAVPSGKVVGASASGGPGFGGLVIGGEEVLNYNSGQTSAFGYAGVQVGCCSFLSGGVYTAAAYGLSDDNSNYSGGFTSVTVSGQIVSASVSRSSGGLAGPQALLHQTHRARLRPSESGSVQGLALCRPCLHPKRITRTRFKLANSQVSDSPTISRSAQGNFAKRLGSK